MADTTPAESYWLCPLYSFDCYTESVDLAEGIQIKTAPNELRKYINEQTHYPRYGQRDDPSKFNWVVSLPHPTIAAEGTIEHRMGIGMKEWATARELLVDLIMTLKLCHKGSVTAGPLIITSINNSEYAIGGGTQWTTVSKKDYLLQKPIYKFQQSDIPRVNELLENIRNLDKEKKHHNIDIALRRFHSSYHGQFEDRLIDQMIAFESLYLGHDPELNYRLALRVTFLLGKDEKERTDIFNNMKKAYNIRSNIVHGNRQVEISELSSIVPKTEEYLRQSIRRFLLLLSQGESLKALKTAAEDKLAKLDENILNNGNLLA